MRRIVVAVIVCVLFHLSVAAQENIFLPEQYDFINYDTNEIVFPGGETDFNSFYEKMDDLVFKGNGKINIVHFGGSHLQADVYSQQMRSHLQKMNPGLNGGRGLIFPYRMAKTNNPSNYRITYTGNWQYCRNTERKKSCNIGLSGIMVRTADSVSGVNIILKEDYGVYHTDRIRVYHNAYSSNYEVDLKTSDPYIIREVINMRDSGYTDIYLNNTPDTFNLEFYRTDSMPEWFEFYGVQLMSSEPGIVYHSVGVNGASIPSFLRCNLLAEQLHAIKPDMIIVSIGTNDAYSRKFDPEVYRRNYISLIKIFREVAPDAVLLLTVPNDNYLYRRYKNYNTAKQEKVIYELAKEYNCGVWNFYQIMGGLNSTPVWIRNGLMRKDKIHFTRAGYLLKGDLFYDAFVRSYGGYLEKKSSEISINQSTVNDK